MTTPLVRSTMKWMSEAEIDIADVYWFDISNIDRNKGVSQTYLNECRPPFEKCMVVYQGSSKAYPSYEVLMMVVGRDVEEGICVSVWKGPTGQRLRKLPLMVYVVEEGTIKYGSVYEDETVSLEEADLMLSMVAFWYESISRKAEAYVPSIAQTFTNRRKIASGKKPTYEWRTVLIEPTATRRESLGGTHASPRLHDRRGHLRRLRSGKNVWVRPCKVGRADLGTVFHDYEVRA